MDDFSMPIVELRLKHMGQQIVQAFAMYEGELNGHIEKSVAALLTDESIQKEIDRLCYECLKECIEEVFESAVVRRDLIKIMTDQVLARINVAPPVQYPPIVLPPVVVPTGTGTPPPIFSIPTAQTEDEFWTSVKKDV